MSRKKAKKSLAQRLLFWGFVICLLLTMASFLAAKTGEGGLLSVYEPDRGAARSEAELEEAEARLGIGFIGTEFLFWTVESLKGNFGSKPPTFMALTALLGVAWLFARWRSSKKPSVTTQPDAAQPPPSGLPSSEPPASGAPASGAPASGAPATGPGGPTQT